MSFRYSPTNPFDFHLQIAVAAWGEANPERARAFTQTEVDELFSLFGVGGPLTMEGVDWFAAIIERKRGIREFVESILNSHAIDDLERVVLELSRDVMPYRDRELVSQAH